MDRAALLKRYEAARLSLLSQRGHHTLRFSVFQNDGWVSSSNKLVTEVLCDLWNAAPVLLATPPEEAA